MKLFKLTLAVLFLSLSSIKAQDIRFETSGYMTSKKLSNGQFTNWSAFQKAAMVVSFNLEKKRFVVYAKDVQMYNINEVLDTKSTKNDEIITFDCTDQSGTPCLITLATRKNKNNLKQLYIYYDNFAVTYNMLFLKQPKKTKK